MLIVQLNKIITLIIIALNYLPYFGQDSVVTCKCEATYNPINTKGDTTNRQFNKKYTKMNLIDSESQCKLFILKDSADYFYVKTLLALNKVDKFWVKKSAAFGMIPTGNDAGYIILHEYPNFKSKKVFIRKYGCGIKQEAPANSFSVDMINCNGKWLKIVLTFKGKKYTGWTKFYCSNNCTNYC